MIGQLIVTAVPAMVLAAGLTAPKTVRYRIESKTEQIVDATAVGGPKQEVTINQVAIVTVSLTDSAGGKVMHVVVDSVTSDAPQPDLSTILAKAKGAWLHGFLDAWGRGTIAATSADSNEIVTQLRPTLARFFPVLKPGAKQGDSWADTSNMDIKSASRAMKTTRIATYTHAGNATWAGATAVRLDATSAASGAGTMENPMAGTMEIESTTTGTESFYVSADGTYLGGEGKQDGDSKVRAAMLPDAIPVKTKTTTSVTLVK